MQISFASCYLTRLRKRIEVNSMFSVGKDEVGFRPFSG